MSVAHGDRSELRFYFHPLDQQAEAKSTECNKKGRSRGNEVEGKQTHIQPVITCYLFSVNLRSLTRTNLLLYWTGICHQRYRIFIYIMQKLGTATNCYGQGEGALTFSSRRTLRCHVHSMSCSACADNLEWIACK